MLLEKIMHGKPIIAPQTIAVYESFFRKMQADLPNTNYSFIRNGIMKIEIC